MEDKIFLVSFLEPLRVESCSNSRVQTSEAPWVGDACFLNCHSVYICIVAFIAIALPRPLYPPSCLPMSTLLYLFIAFSPSGGYLGRQSLEFLKHRFSNSVYGIASTSRSRVALVISSLFSHLILP